MDNHINMVKFLSEKHSKFKRVASHLILMAKRAPAKVRENWLTEGSIKATRVRNLKQNFDVTFDLTGIPKTSAFIWRKSDLNLMKEQLMPGKVLDCHKIYIVHGLCGIGKTQLAIKYARLHKAVYSSFFWLDGKTEESLIQSLLQIVLRLPKGQIADVDAQEIKGLEESRKRAQEVLRWFALKENTQWLLVYDNIDKTSYKETSDQNSESSLIYNII
ncbi:hypothetical protein B0J14DRAFT_687841 [Halenospora varia]|nr:hypothetical protein B0J14DRAFT_687841 [Halenospora varia]